MQYSFILLNVTPCTLYLYGLYKCKFVLYVVFIHSDQCHTLYKCMFVTPRTSVSKIPFINSAQCHTQYKYKMCTFGPGVPGVPSMSHLARVYIQAVHCIAQYMCKYSIYVVVHLVIVHLVHLVQCGTVWYSVVEYDTLNQCYSVVQCGGV